MKSTPLYLTGLTNDEQQKLEPSLQSRLFGLQQSSSLETTVHGLMTVDGDANVLSPELRKQYGDNLAVAYSTGSIISFDAPANLFYELAKDQRVTDISVPRKSQPNWR